MQRSTLPLDGLRVIDFSRVLAGPLFVARRRAYHREWLVGFEGVTARVVVEAWRDRFLAVEDDDAHD